MTPRVTLEGDIILDLSWRTAPEAATSTSRARTFRRSARARSTTRLRLRDGESNLLAGLLREDERRTLRGFPACCTLPVLSKLFAVERQRHQDQTDIVMLLTPRIVRTQEITAGDLQSDLHRHAAEPRPQRAAAAHRAVARAGTGSSRGSTTRAAGGTERGSARCRCGGPRRIDCAAGKLANSGNDGGAGCTRASGCGACDQSGCAGRRHRRCANCRHTARHRLPRGRRSLHGRDLGDQRDAPLWSFADRHVQSVRGACAGRSGGKLHACRRRSGHLHADG